MPLEPQVVEAASLSSRHGHLATSTRRRSPAWAAAYSRACPRARARPARRGKFTALRCPSGCDPSVKGKSMSKEPKEKANCDHMENCEMYSLITRSGTLSVWQGRYCTDDFKRLLNLA